MCLFVEAYDTQWELDLPLWKNWETSPSLAKPLHLFMANQVDPDRWTGSVFALPIMQNQAQRRGRHMPKHAFRYAWDHSLLKKASMQFSSLYSFLPQLWAASCACPRRTASRTSETPSHTFANVFDFAGGVQECFMLFNGLFSLTHALLQWFPCGISIQTNTSLKRILARTWKLLHDFVPLNVFFLSIAEGLHSISIKGLRATFHKDS